MWLQSDKNCVFDQDPELIDISITEVCFWSDRDLHHRDEYFAQNLKIVRQVLNFGQNIHPCNRDHHQTRKTLQWLRYQSAQGLDWKLNFCLIAITIGPEEYLIYKATFFYQVSNQDMGFQSRNAISQISYRDMGYVSHIWIWDIDYSQKPEGHCASL